MKKKLTALLCAAAMVLAAVPQAIAEDGEKILGNEIYKEGNFTVYDEVNAPGEITNVWEDFGIEATMESNWNSDNGVKTDITEYVKGRSGQTFTLSVQAQNWAWEGDGGAVNKAKAFFKTVAADGTEKITDIAEGPDTVDEIDSNIAVITGSAALTFADTDTVYLCFTHGAGQQQYKEISLIAGSAPPVSGGETALFGNEVFTEGKFKLYDDANTAGTIEVWENDGISADMGNDWSDVNGVKLDVTEYIQGYSGETFNLTVKATNWAWNGDGSVNKLNAFFETADGTRTDIFSGPDSADAIAEDNSTVLSGSAVLSFSASDTVYLCFTHGAGVQQYRDISLTVSTESKPPVSEGTVYFENDIFKEGNFEVYNAQTASGSISQVWEDFGVEAQFDSGWNSDNGVKTNITDYIKGHSGEMFSLSVDAANWAWDGEDGGVNMVYAFFEAVHADGTSDKAYIFSGPETHEAIVENTASLNGTVQFTFDDTDTVYLCFTHGGGTQQYKNIKLSSKPAEGGSGLIISEPAIGDNGAYIEATNTTGADAVINVYAVSYESGAVKSVEVKTITVPDGADKLSCPIPGNSGDTVLVWDNNLKPLTMKKVLS